MDAEVAAAARGLLAGGADEVVVFDNHASGNPFNVSPESLPAGARLESWHMFDLRERGVDALLQLGYHSRAELDAFLLGGCGNDVHARTLGSLDGVPHLVTQHTSSPVDARPAASLDEIEAFAEDVARAGGVPVRPPERARFEAFVRVEPLLCAGHPALAGHSAADRRRDGGSRRTVALLLHHVRPDK
jgi:hypothetical protein